MPLSCKVDFINIALGDETGIKFYTGIMIDLKFSFTSKIWLWQAEKAAWHFATLPVEMSEDIKAFTKHLARGFRSVKVEARIGDTAWKTSIFPSKDRGAYILPIKKSIRIVEGIGDASSVMIDLRIPI